MSIVAFKNKSAVRYGSGRSGKPPGGKFVTQGPFGLSGSAGQPVMNIVNYGPNGFSLTGSHRNIGRVGQSMAMSKSGTPFRGIYPVGNGGCCGQYATPLPTFNSNKVNTQGDQYQYVKPSVLSERGMLRKKYRYLYNGQYPNYSVKDVFTGDMTDNASQSVYISKVSAANCINTDINESDKFIGFSKKCGSTGCNTTTARYKYATMAANAPYTKTTKNPMDSSAYTLYVKRPCATYGCDPDKKPYPVPDNGNGSACAVAISSTLL
jgi:hypothetical protein